MKERIKRFMIGRNGVDQLSFAMIIFAILLNIIDIFVKKSFLNFISLATSFIALYRVFSKDRSSRAEENRKFVNMLIRWKYKLQRSKKRLEERKTYKYLKCPACHQKLRVPRGKGRIKLTCPKCNFKFEGRS